MKILETLLLIFVTFLPPILYAFWIRNTEKFNREKWIPIILCFIWGATIAVIASIILELILHFSIAPSIGDANIMALITIIILAPFVEEFTKPLILGFKIVKKELDEIEDGLIFGAVTGLGFSATENLLYGTKFMTYGLIIFIVLIFFRSFGACLLHASATAWTGYGYGKTIMKHSRLIQVLPYFLMAVFVHAFYNSFLSFEIPGALTGLFAALALASITIILIRKKIRVLDEISGP